MSFALLLESLSTSASAVCCGASYYYDSSVCGAVYAWLLLAVCYVHPAASSIRFPCGDCCCCCCPSCVWRLLLSAADSADSGTHMPLRTCRGPHISRRIKTAPSVASAGVPLLFDIFRGLAISLAVSLTHTTIEGATSCNCFLMAVEPMLLSRL